MNFLKKIKTTFRYTRNYLYKPNPNATLLLGLNKSGTTVTIHLIAHRAGLTFTDDPTYKIGGFDNVLNKGRSLKSYLDENSYMFSKEIIRFPIEPRSLACAKSFFNMDKYIVTVRNPINNIKSILSRLGIGGKLEELDTNNLNFHKDWVYMLTRKENYIASLAQCWVDAYDQDLIFDENKSIIFKYEDFMSDKIGYITKKVIELGYEPKNDIQSLIDIQFQPKGTGKANNDFFSKKNLEIVKNMTGNLASKFGYNL